MTSAAGRDHWAALGASTSPFGGKLAGLKNPRGPITVKRFDRVTSEAAGHGAYLLLFYNNNGKNYLHRKTYWLAAGWEVAGKHGAAPTVLFSQPEVVLYEVDTTAASRGPGYPDFIETQAAHGGWDVVITETQKTEARLHTVPRALVAGLFAQHNASAIAPGSSLTLGPESRDEATPPFPAFGVDGAATGFGGLGLAFALTLDDHSNAGANPTIFSSAVGVGAGVSLTVGPKAGGMVTLSLSDGKVTFSLATDEACSAALGKAGRHFVGAVADGGPRIASMMVDGVLCDGGGVADFGWATFPTMGSVCGADRAVVARDYGGSIVAGHVYARALSTSELVATYRVQSSARAA
eukprot:7385143-Prymnesium_polylepis.4